MPLRTGNAGRLLHMQDVQTDYPRPASCELTSRLSLREVTAAFCASLGIHEGFVSRIHEGFDGKGLDPSPTPDPRTYRGATME